MKFHAFALSICLGIGLLSGCSHLANSTDSASTQSNSARVKKHHLSGGSGASLEIPFNSARGPRTTVDPVATNTPQTDPVKSKSRRVSESD